MRGKCRLTAGRDGGGLPLFACGGEKKMTINNKADGCKNNADEGCLNFFYFFEGKSVREVGSGAMGARCWPCWASWG